MLIKVVSAAAVSVFFLAFSGCGTGLVNSQLPVYVNWSYDPEEVDNNFLAAINSYGFVYNHTVKPLNSIHRPTAYSGTGAKGSIKQLDLRVVPVNFDWSSNAIGDIAKKHGIQEVYFADMEVFSILGIWTRRTVRIYGR